MKHTDAKWQNNKNAGKTVCIIHSLIVFAANAFQIQLIIALLMALSHN